MNEKISFYFKTLDFLSYVLSFLLISEWVTSNPNELGHKCNKVSQVQLKGQ